MDNGFFSDFRLIKAKLKLIFNRITHHRFYPYAVLLLILWIILKGALFFLFTTIMILVSVIFIWILLLIIIEKKKLNSIRDVHLSIIKINDFIDLNLQCDVCERFLERNEEYAEYGENKKNKIMP